VRDAYLQELAGLDLEGQWHSETAELASKSSTVSNQAGTAMFKVLGWRQSITRGWPHNPARKCPVSPEIANALACLVKACRFATEQSEEDFAEELIAAISALAAYLEQ
jgi:hypothetical protein